MARYELSKNDFKLIDEALKYLASAYQHNSRMTELRDRFARAHTAYLDEDGNG